MDPVRVGVKESVSLLREAGVRTVMITGDFPETAVSVAKQIGLDTNDIMSGSDLAQLSDSELKSRVRQTSVFCRIRPEQKLQLVELLQLQGEVVAMTGDGVNDAPALRAADVGIAMGKRGSEVAREASDLVVADDSFNSIAAGVTEGRRIFANLRKATIYVVAIHVPIFGMALLPLISLSWPLVLLPLQIALLEFIIDPSASLVYEREKAGRGQMKSPPRGKGVHLMSRPTLLFALVQGLALLAGVAAVYFWSIGMGLGDESVRSNAFLVLLLGNILTMLANRSQFSSIIEIMLRGDNRFAYGLTTVALLLIVTIFSVGPVSSALGLVAIDPSNLPIIVLASMAGLLAAEILKSFGRISKKVN
jgi:Ca2+-transporting ATPase